MTAPYALESYAGYLSTVKAKNTVIKYIDSAKFVLQFCDAEKIAFDKMPLNVLERFVTWLDGRGAAPRSIHVYVAGTKNYLRWCEGQGLAATRMHADLPKAPPPIPNALRDESLLAYLREASKIHEPYRTALLLLPYTGLRSNELVRLSMQAVKLVDLPVRGGGGHRQHLCFVIRGKGEEVRVVPVLLDGVPIFLKYMRDWRSHVSAPDWIFPGPGGEGPIATRTIRSHVQQIRARVPSPGRLTPHALRDTYATTLWKCGVDPVTLTKAMGHRSVQTTMNHYLDIQEQDVAGVIVQRGARLVMDSPAAQQQAPLMDFLRRTEAERRGS